METQVTDNRDRESLQPQKSPAPPSNMPRAGMFRVVWISTRPLLLLLKVLDAPARPARATHAACAMCAAHATHAAHATRTTAAHLSGAACAALSLSLSLLIYYVLSSLSLFIFSSLLLSPRHFRLQRPLRKKAQPCAAEPPMLAATRASAHVGARRHACARVGAHVGTRRHASARVGVRRHASARVGAHRRASAHVRRCGAPPRRAAACFSWRAQLRSPLPSFPLGSSSRIAINIMLCR